MKTIKYYLKIILEGVIGSLDTSTKPFSARKLSAVIAIIMVCIADVKWFQSNHWEYFGEFLMIHFTFILVCLGLATWQYVKTNETKS